MQSLLKSKEKNRKHELIFYLLKLYFANYKRWRYLSFVVDSNIFLGDRTWSHDLCFLIDYELIGVPVVLIRYINRLLTLKFISDVKADPDTIHFSI